MSRHTTLIAVLALACAAPGLFAQSSGDYRFAGPFSAQSFITYRFEQNDSFAPYVDPLIAPVGWSKDGKLAYVLEHNYEAMGVGPVFEWIIQDMVSDEVVWTSKPNPEQWAEEHPQTEGLSGAQALRSLFPEMLAQHRAQLQRHGIVAGPAPLLARFPAASGGLRFESAIRDIRRGEAFETEDAILAYRVVAERSDKRSKTLGTVARSSEEWPVLDVQAAGYIQSPYEARIAVVLCTTSRGWEGPPHPVSYSLVGCNLKTGFK